MNERNGNEFHNSETQRRIFDETPWRGNFFWKIFLHFYVAYTENQERMSPKFQQLMARIKEKYGNNVPRELCEEFRCGSRPLMKYTNILTFNSRAIMLCFSMLTGVLWLYFIFELVVLMIIFTYMRYKHELLCKRLTKKIDEGYEFS